MYHLSEDGNPRICRAKPGNCPLGDQSQHFNTADDARKQFEKRMRLTVGLVQEIPHTLGISSSVEELLDRLYGSGLEPYVVGGSVRDSLVSGAEPKDVDIEIFDGQSIDHVESLLSAHGYPISTVGKSFGVLKLITPQGDDIDISMPRRDSKTGVGHRGFAVTVDPSLNLKEAAGRRDFTINALYYSHRERLIRDYFGALEDWNERKLRHINEHFGEDPLRVLRGVQFAARFRMELAPETAELSRSMRSEYSNISVDRIQTELDKFLSKGDAVYGMAAFRETGWDELVGLREVTPSVAQDANDAMDRGRTEDYPIYGASHLLRAAPRPKSTVELLLVGQKRQQKALALLDATGPVIHSEEGIRSWARSIEKKSLSVKDWHIYTDDKNTARRAQELGIYERADPDFLTGEIVLSHTDKKPGPWIGELIREANLAQDRGEIRNSKDAENWVAKRL